MNRTSLEWLSSNCTHAIPCECATMVNMVFDGIWWSTMNYHGRPPIPMVQDHGQPWLDCHDHDRPWSEQSWPWSELPWPWSTMVELPWPWSTMVELPWPWSELSWPWSVLPWSCQPWLNCHDHGQNCHEHGQNCHDHGWQLVRTSRRKKVWCLQQNHKKPKIDSGKTLQDEEVIMFAAKTQ